MDTLVIVEFISVAVLIISAIRLVARGDRSGRKRRTDRRGSEWTPTEGETDSSLAHAEVVVSWAQGTRGDWDRHVRPVLAREFDNLVGSRRATTPSTRQTGRFLFGAELWRLVDPTERFTEQRSRPGPGRRALADILDRLEEA
ncbi:MAG: hypothetical protein ACRDQ7_10520 [Haloechinothrix sp.]